MVNPEVCFILSFVVAIYRYPLKILIGDVGNMRRPSLGSPVYDQ